MKASDTFRPFSNGEEFRTWLALNCQRGERGCRSYNPNAPTSRHGCPIEVALSLGYVGDGEIPARIGLRGGLLEPGERGELVPADDPWRCPEYRGYDEPDDRPRRGPRPSDGQLDLLDPRHTSAPERVPVTAAAPRLNERTPHGR